MMMNMAPKMNDKVKKNCAFTYNLFFFYNNRAFPRTKCVLFFKKNNIDFSVSMYVTKG